MAGWEKFMLKKQKQKKNEYPEVQRPNAPVEVDSITKIRTAWYGGWYVSLNNMWNFFILKLNAMSGYQILSDKSRKYVRLT
uniref:Uncharacterized protein n=1 Tax=Anopheles minimus TaxID=112268 RepID=A0A182WQD5_9DIPT